MTNLLRRIYYALKNRDHAFLSVKSEHEHCCLLLHYGSITYAEINDAESSSEDIVERMERHVEECIWSGELVAITAQDQGECTVDNSHREAYSVSYLHGQVLLTPVSHKHSGISELIGDSHTRNIREQWEQRYDDVRTSTVVTAEYIPKPIEPTREYLSGLQSNIRAFWKPGAKVSVIDTFPIGIVMGDVLAQAFGARWEYGAIAPGMIDEHAIADHQIVIDKSAFQFLPFVRIQKFLNNPDWNLTSIWDGMSAVTRGEIQEDEMSIREIGPDSTFAYIRDEHGGDE